MWRDDGLRMDGGSRLFAPLGAAQAHPAARPEQLDPAVPRGGPRDRDLALLRGDPRSAARNGPDRDADRRDRLPGALRQEAGDRADPARRPAHGPGMSTCCPRRASPMSASTAIRSPSTRSNIISRRPRTAPSAWSSSSIRCSPPAIPRSPRSTGEGSRRRDLRFVCLLAARPGVETLARRPSRRADLAAAMDESSTTMAISSPASAMPATAPTARARVGSVPTSSSHPAKAGFHLATEPSADSAWMPVRWHDVEK